MTDRRRRNGSAWIWIVVAACFGPYLAPGIRTEQLAIYGSALVAASLGMRVHRAARPILVILSVPIAVGIAGTLIPPRSLGPFHPGIALAGLDSYLIAGASVYVTACWVIRYGAGAVTRAAAQGVGALSAAAGAVSVAQSFGLVTRSLLGGFWSWSGVSSELVADRALQSARYTGIFNQPVEAGLVFSLGLLSIVYLLLEGSHRWKWAPLALHISVVLILSGAVLSQSKIGLAGAALTLGLLAIRSLRHEDARPLFARFLAATLAVSATALSWSAWYGSTRLVSVLGAAGVAPSIDLYTAGRYGQGGALLTRASLVLAKEPFFGFGIRGFDAPYDSEWLQWLVVAGIVGMVSYVCLLAYLWHRWLAVRSSLSNGSWVLATGVAALLVVAGLGMPATTANRGGALLLIFLISSVVTYSNLATSPAAPRKTAPTSS